MFNKKNKHGVSQWIIIFAWVLGTFGSLMGILAIWVFPDAIAGDAVDAYNIVRTWGGRSLGIGIGMMLSAYIGRKAPLFVIFAVAFIRELSDAVSSLMEGDLPVATLAIVVLVLNTLVLWNLKSAMIE